MEAGHRMIGARTAQLKQRGLQAALIGRSRASRREGTAFERLAEYRDHARDLGQALRPSLLPHQRRAGQCP
jgi:hypothetical protein